MRSQIQFLGSAHLFFELAWFDYPVKKQLGAPCKIYGIDTAFSILGWPPLSPDKVKTLENIVFIEIKRRGKEVFYFSGTKACDFVIKDGRSITGAIQVCNELNEKNMGRECGGLLEAMESFHLELGLILTSDQEYTRKVGPRTVLIKPVWKLLLEDELHTLPSDGS